MTDFLMLIARALLLLCIMGVMASLVWLAIGFTLSLWKLKLYPVALLVLAVMVGTTALFAHEYFKEIKINRERVRQ